MATDDDQIRWAILDDTLALVNGYKSYINQPHISRDMHLIVKNIGFT